MPFIIDLDDDPAALRQSYLDAYHFCFGDNVPDEMILARFDGRELEAEDVVRLYEMARGVERVLKRGGDGRS